MIPILLLAAVLNMTAAQPDELPDHVKSLSKISVIRVIVGKLTPEALDYGLTADQLQTDIELKLRLAGIKVTSTPSNSGQLFLSVSHKEIKSDKTAVAFYAHVGLNFHQLVTLYGNKNQVSASTWTDDVIFAGRPSQGTDLTRQVVRDSIDTFINDYLAANPKP